MPVHRHLHDKQGSVYAFRRDLDVWARGRIGRLAVSDLPPEPAPDEPSERPNDAAVVARPGAPRPRLGPWILGAAAILVVTAVTVWQLQRDRSSKVLMNARFQGLPDFPGDEQAAAVSATAGS